MCAEDEEQKSNSTNLDYTEKDSITVNFGKEVRKLKESSWITPEYYICGQYKIASGWTGGHFLYLFPNGIFVLEEYGDISIPIWAARGSWQLLEGKIILKIEKRNESKDVIFDFEYFKKGFGSGTEWLLRFLKDGDRLGDPILIPAIEKEDNEYEWNFLYQVTHYLDWEKTLNRFIEPDVRGNE